MRYESSDRGNHYSSTSKNYKSKGKNKGSVLARKGPFTMNGSTLIHTTYDLRLVILSVLIAMLASYAALELAMRVTTSRNTARTAWLFGGAMAMGTGIWSMHYTGMIACRFPIAVYCHVPTSVLSLVAAIAASFVALFVVSRERMTAFHLIAGSMLMAAGIASMHYTGMAAMRLSAMHHYDNDLLIASIVIAWLVSLAALGLIKMNLVLNTSTDNRAGTAAQAGREGSEKLLTLVSSLTMGVAIPAMHYTGMAAVSYRSMAEAPDLTNAVEISSVANGAIIVVTVVMLMAVFLLRWLTALPPIPQTSQQGQAI